MTLSRRIERLESGMAWAEDPPSRTRHLITNVEVEAGDAASEIKAYSNYLVYRSRAETEQDFYVRGARGRPQAHGRRVEARPPHHRTGSDRAVGQKREHLFLTFSPWRPIAGLRQPFSPAALQSPIRFCVDSLLSPHREIDACRRFKSIN